VLLINVTFVPFLQKWSILLTAVNVNRNMESAANRKWQHITKQALHRYYVYIMVFIATLDEEGLVTEAALWVELGLDKFLL